MNIIVEEVNRIQNFDVLAAVRNADNPQIDHSISYCAGRDGSWVSILEEFDPITGYLSRVFWKSTFYNLEYDEAQRTKMIYG